MTDNMRKLLLRLLWLLWWLVLPFLVIVIGALFENIPKTWLVASAFFTACWPLGFYLFRILRKKMSSLARGWLLSVWGIGCVLYIGLLIWTLVACQVWRA